MIDLSPLERRGLFLEGTGSLVMDWRRGLAYAALSARTHGAAVEEFTRRTGVPVLTFNTSDGTGQPLYHTNVMLSIGEDFAVICAEAITVPTERQAVLRELAGSGRQIIEITLRQMGDFAANILEVGTGAGRTVIALSATAHAAFSPGQAVRLHACAPLVVVPIPTIEQVGGGSVRCMLAEVFPPPAA